MLNDFICPKCNGHLRVGENIIFTAKTKKWEGGIILLHPELGNYKVENHPSFKFESGEHVDLYGPICHAKLKSKKHKSLATVIMKDESGKEFEIYFSQIVGEQSTFKLIGEHVEIFGEHTEVYRDFFDLSQII